MRRNQEAGNTASRAPRNHGSTREPVHGSEKQVLVETIKNDFVDRPIVGAASCAVQRRCSRWSSLRKHLGASTWGQALGDFPLGSRLIHLRRERCPSNRPPAHQICRGGNSEDALGCADPARKSPALLVIRSNGPELFRSFHGVTATGNRRNPFQQKNIARWQECHRADCPH